MTFDDLLQAYRTSPEDMFKQVSALSAQERHTLLVENSEKRLHDNRVLEEADVAVLPREYRRIGGVRWDHFGYVLHYFDRKMMEHHLLGHLAIESEDSKATYMSHMLAMLAWMSVDHRLDGEEEAEVSTSKKRSRRG